ncbi:MAG: twin-arginine translocase TatA/TatE family subunit [Planctomycetes bacterium]|nr:twin-arginine translocase TatA/TatE family subunit [Planctomycetota bacterium]
MITPLLAFFAPGPFEMMIVGVIALLLFGKRLPEVARSLGRGLVEFKRGVKGIEEEVDTATYDSVDSSTSSRPVPEEESASDEVSAPKFEPPPTEPRDTTVTDSSGENVSAKKFEPLPSESKDASATES